MGKIDIFDIVKPYDNDNIGSMDREYRDDFFKYLNQYMLGLRESLDLSMNDTFGIEIEVDNITKPFYEISKKDLYKDFSFITDDTIDYGMEIVSPKLIDNKDIWLKIGYLLKDLSICSNISACCAGHIHIGAHLLKGEINNYINLLKVFAAYENIIFRFGYGEFLTERTNYNRYYAPIVEKVIKWCNNNSFVLAFYEHVNALRYNIPYDKVSDCIKVLDNMTIEIRNPNGSLNPIIWQNNVNFLIKLIKYATSDNFNEKLIMKRLEALNELCKNDNIMMIYRLVDIKGALELADLIFDKNIDKVYFLRQYIKNYEVGNEMLEKGKKFTKNPNY